MSETDFERLKGVALPDLTKPLTEEEQVSYATHCERMKSELALFAIAYYNPETIEKWLKRVGVTEGKAYKELKPLLSRSLANLCPGEVVSSLAVITYIAKRNGFLSLDGLVPHITEPIVALMISCYVSGMNPREIYRWVYERYMNSSVSGMRRLDVVNAALYLISEHWAPDEVAAFCDNMFSAAEGSLNSSQKTWCQDMHINENDEHSVCSIEEFEHLKHMATQGDVAAMLKIGLACVDGHFPQDMIKALCWYRKAAENGCAEAMYKLGLCYNQGVGVNISYDLAVKWFCKAADHGSLQARRTLKSAFCNNLYPNSVAPEYASFLRKYKGQAACHTICSIQALETVDDWRECDDVKALEWLHRAKYRQEQYVQRHIYYVQEYYPVDLKYAMMRRGMQSLLDTDGGLYLIGDAYYRGNDCPVDHGKALCYFQMLADKGDVEAMLRIGEIYQYADGDICLDYVEGLKWLTMAAEKGDADAAFNIGVLHYHGCGVPHDGSLALKWFRIAADRGSAAALVQIGIMRRYGEGTDVDFCEALSCFVRAAEKESVNAMTQIAHLYDYNYDNNPIGPSMTKAEEWYRKAATAGSAVAMRELGESLSNTRYRTDKWWEGWNILTTAAERGDPYAMKQLAFMNSYSQELANQINSFICYCRSAERGNEDAMFFVGKHFAEGRVVLQNYEEAMQWYYRAAMKGQVGAMRSIADMHRQGNGVEKSECKYEEWVNVNEPFSNGV